MTPSRNDYYAARQRVGEGALPDPAEEKSAVPLKDFVDSDETSGVDHVRTRIRRAPDAEQRRLIPIAKGGGQGVVRLLETAGVNVAQESAAMQEVLLRYTVTDSVEDRDFDAGADDLAATRNVLATLIEDLKVIFGGT